MRILFTTSRRLGSRLIQWGSGEDISHVAVCVGNFVVHATPRGVDVDYLPRFLQSYHPKYTLVSIYPASASAKFDSILSYEGAGYDWLALAYMAVRALGTRLLGLPWPPPRNIWARTGYFNCVEFASAVVGGVEESALTPKQFYDRLAMTGEWTSPHV